MNAVSRASLVSRAYRTPIIPLRLDRLAPRANIVTLTIIARATEAMQQPGTEPHRTDPGPRRALRKPGGSSLPGTHLCHQCLLSTRAATVVGECKFRL